MLVEHAIRELKLCGQTDEDPAYSAALVATIAAWSSYRHSGGSAACSVSQLATLLQYGTLSPLTNAPEEWMLVTAPERHRAGLWQSVRNPQAMSNDGGVTHYLIDERKPSRWWRRHRNVIHRSAPAVASGPEREAQEPAIPSAW